MNTLLIKAVFIALFLTPFNATAGPELGDILQQVITNKMQQRSGMMNPAQPADLVVSSFTIQHTGSEVHYTVKFKNIGQGPARCFDYVVGDSAKGIRTVGICPSSNWTLQPGEEIEHYGTVSKYEMWVWPDERGYNSKIYVNANHGRKTAEDVINNNSSGKWLIRWGLNN